VVREGDAVEDAPVVIGVEGGETTVPGLHAFEPGERAGFDGGLLRGVGGLAVFEGEEHHGGVVDVGVVFVGVFKGPAAGLEVGAFDGPVAAAADLFADEPVGGVAEGGGVEVVGFAEGEGSVGGVPDGGEAGLEVDAFGGFGEQRVELGDGFEEIGVVLGGIRALRGP
jgi:hypothetical protein